MSSRACGVFVLVTLVSVSVCCTGERVPHAPDTAWDSPAGDLLGTRFAENSIITPKNVHRLRRSWATRLGEPGIEDEAIRRTMRWEATPVLSEGRLLISTPSGRALALDPSTGEVLWTFDSKLNLARTYLEGLTTRGLAVWKDESVTAPARCRSVILLTTVDATLHSIDSVDGMACEDFGDNGRIDLRAGAGLGQRDAPVDQYTVTSPPIVVSRRVIVGSAVHGNARPSRSDGVVRAFDVRTGELAWSFTAITRAPLEASSREEGQNRAQLSGGAHVWSLMSADTTLDLVFLPTAAPTPNHTGSERRGKNEFANSIIALRASTGAFVWAFQTVHHDLWDYDVASQPILATVLVDGVGRKAVIVMNKAGMVFVLDRESGRPLVPFSEIETPTSDLAEEEAWPSQPVTGRGSVLHEGRLTADSMFGLNETDRMFCLDWFSRLRYDGPFTPPSAEGSLNWPGVWGGPNWDGASWDPRRQLMFITMRRIASVIRLRGMTASREHFVSPSGLPCTPPPWSALVAYSPADQRIAWAEPLGSIPSLRAADRGRGWGSLAFGGSVATAGGLVFVAASQDAFLRAYASESGAVLWEHRLPAGGQAAPMSFVSKGQQYIVIAAGGRAGVGTPGDWIVAFSF